MLPGRYGLVHTGAARLPLHDHPAGPVPVPGVVAGSTRHLAAVRSDRAPGQPGSRPVARRALRQVLTGAWPTAVDIRPAAGCGRTCATLPVPGCAPLVVLGCPPLRAG